MDVSRGWERVLAGAAVRAVVVGFGGSVLGCFPGGLGFPFVMLLAGTLAVLEHFALERCASGRQRIFFTFLNWALATLGLAFAYFQGVYMTEVVKTGSITAGFVEVRHAVDVLLGLVAPRLGGRGFDERDVALFRVVWFPACVAPAFALTLFKRVSVRAGAPWASLTPLLVVPMALACTVELAVLRPLVPREQESLMGAIIMWTTFTAVQALLVIPAAAWVVSELTRYSDMLERRLLGPSDSSVGQGFSSGHDRTSSDRDPRGPERAPGS